MIDPSTPRKNVTAAVGSSENLAGAEWRVEHLLPLARGTVQLALEPLCLIQHRVNRPAKPTPPPPIVRLATDDDVLAMAKVHIASWRETYPGLLPEPMLAKLSVASEAIRRQRMLDRPRPIGDALAFVADEEGEVVAYGSCNEQRTAALHDRGFTGEVSELYVLRRAQRRGAGSGLMQAMASALVERGHRAFSLWVLERNAPARLFYERLGGALVAERRAGFAEVAYGWSGRRMSALSQER